MKKALAKPRTLVVLSVRANDPDGIDGMGFEERRNSGLGWEELTLVHPGAPDVAVRKALELDLGVFRGERQWQAKTKCVVDTYFLPPEEVKGATKLLARQVAKPAALASRLIAYLGAEASKDDPKRVASALVDEPKPPALGPAEEAASWIRAFRLLAPTAIEFRLGMAWELRTPSRCYCAAIEDELPGKVDFKRGPRSFEYQTLASSTTGGRVRCKKCRATFAYTYGPLSTVVTREAKPKKQAKKASRTTSKTPSSRRKPATATRR